MSTKSGMDDNAVIRGLELRLDTFIAGLETALPAGVTQIKVGRVTFSISDLIAKAKELNQPYKSKRAARSVLRQAALTAEDDREAALDFLADAKAALVALLGRKTAELVDFGFTPQGGRRKKAKSAKADTNQGSGRTDI